MNTVAAAVRARGGEKRAPRELLFWAGPGLTRCVRRARRRWTRSAASSRSSWEWTWRRCVRGRPGGRGTEGWEVSGPPPAPLTRSRRCQVTAASKFVDLGADSLDTVRGAPRWPARPASLTQLLLTRAASGRDHDGAGGAVRDYPRRGRCVCLGGCSRPRGGSAPGPPPRIRRTLSALAHPRSPALSQARRRSPPCRRLPTLSSPRPSKHSLLPAGRRAATAAPPSS